MNRHPWRLSGICVCLLTVSAVASLAADDETKAVRLFNGNDLTGWTPFLWNPKTAQEDTATPADKVWTVEDGELTCAGRPTGYLRTSEEYANYKLELEWKWPADTNTGNSGVLVHTTKPQVLGQWPQSIEVQLYTRNAGDLWVIGTTLDVPDAEARRKGRRHVNLTDDSENPVGEWNKMEVICQGNEIRVSVNGDLVNHATNCSATRGAIALQSEGARLHFRNIVLTPLDE